MMSTKRYIAVIVALIFAMSLVLPCFANASNGFAGGDGTADNPYLISTKEQLDNVRNKSNDLYFKLTNDIVFTDADFEEGGAYYNDGYGFLPIDGFGGKFDGNGFSIVNLKQDGKNEVEYGGLFGNVHKYKSIKIQNLTLENCSVKNFEFAGGIAGRVSVGGFENCTVSGEVCGTKSVGGLLGATDLTDERHGYFNIFDCCNNATVTLDTTGFNKEEDYYPYGLCLGGIVGYNSGELYNCANNGSLNANISRECIVRIGGIASSTYWEYAVERCCNAGEISIKLHDEYAACYIGGIVASGRVEECYNVGKITVEGAENSSEAKFSCGAITSGFREGTARNYYLEGTAEVPYGDAGKEEHGDLELTAEEMKNRESFVGFDFVTGWRMGDSNGYPYPVQVNTNEGIIALEGKGTKEEPYLVSSPEDLEIIRIWYDSISRTRLYFEMTNDIVFEEADFQEGGAFYNDGNGFAPIGENNGFYGCFNGNGYSIVNMKQSGREKAAIFVGDNANISNLSTKDCVFEATYCAAGISIGGTIENCTSSSIVVAEGTGSAYAGGIAVIAYSDKQHTVNSVKNCANNSDVTAIIVGESDVVKNAYAGGIVASGTCNVYNSYNTGNITAKAENSDAYAGGIVAGGNSNSIVNCYNVGKITAEADSESFVGAICTNFKTEKLSVYYLDETAPSACSGEDNGAVRCTREEMLNAETYKDFGMGVYWEMGDENYPYPVLKKESDAGILFESGSGTKADPFMIATKQQLKNVGIVTYSDSSSYYYKLINDIVFEEADFEEGGAFYNDAQGFLPIGFKTAFNGNFDGSGFKIDGLKQNITAKNLFYAGLFGYTNGATVKNLTLKNCTVKLSNETANETGVGAIAGKVCNSTVSNCIVSESYIENASTKNLESAGGIVGVAENSLIENCSSHADVVIRSYNNNYSVYVGGIAGRFTDLSEMRNSFNTSTVTVIDEYGKYEELYEASMGGLCGYTDESYLINCYSAGKLVCEKQNKGMGGLVGYAYTSLMTVNCAYLENGVQTSVAKKMNALLAPPVYIEPPADKIGGFYTDTVRTIVANEDGSIPNLTFNEADGNYGDVTGDLKVNSKDIAVVQRYVAGRSDTQGIEKMLADVNGDAETNSRDIAELQRTVAG